MKGTKIIVFDLYNTLIEIKKPSKFFITLYKASKKGFNLSITSYLHLVMTKDIEELKQTLPTDFKKLYIQKEGLLNNELNSVFVYDDVVEVLSFLKQHFKLFLISNLASPYKKPFFEANLECFFENILFSCDVGIIKPNPFIFKEIETITKVKPNEILMIGDSYNSDIKGAKNMGWSHLMINRKNQSNNFDIRSLREIKDLIYKK